MLAGTRHWPPFGGCDGCRPLPWALHQFLGDWIDHAWPQRLHRALLSQTARYHDPAIWAFGLLPCGGDVCDGGSHAARAAGYKHLARAGVSSIPARLPPRDVPLLVDSGHLLYRGLHLFGLHPAGDRHDVERPSRRQAQGHSHAMANDSRASVAATVIPGTAAVAALTASVTSTPLHLRSWGWRGLNRACEGPYIVGSSITVNV